MEAEQFVAIVSGAIAKIATVVGGAWGYYRFRKSRSFEPRLTLGVEAQFIHSDSGNGVLCTFEVKNVGLSKVDIDKAHVRMGILSGGDQHIHLTTRKILLAHSWVEPGATLNEQEVVPCAEHNEVVKIDFRLVAAGIAFKTTRVLQIPE